MAAWVSVIDAGTLCFNLKIAQQRDAILVNSLVIGI